MPPASVCTSCRPCSTTSGTCASRILKSLPLPFVSTLLEAINLGKSFGTMLGDLSNLDKDNGQRFSAYLEANDAYNFFAKKASATFSNMKAGIADCKTGGDTQPQNPPQPPGTGKGPYKSKVTSGMDPNDMQTVGFGPEGVHQAGFYPCLYDRLREYPHGHGRGPGGSRHEPTPGRPRLVDLPTR